MPQSASEVPREPHRVGAYEVESRGLMNGTAIVTGGATLIGQAVVRAFHEHGTNVAVADIDAERGEALANELDRVFFSTTDLRDDAQIQRFVAETVERFGGVDFLVNLACSYVDEGLASPREDWLESLNVNVVSAVMMAKAVRPHMAAKGGGAIVNFTSISAKVAQTGRWLYPVGKAALVQLTRNMAMDLAPLNIRVNCVCPGTILTRASYDYMECSEMSFEEFVASESPKHLVGRLGQPREVANAILFLASDEASFITGTSLVVDGGYMVR